MATTLLTKSVAWKTYGGTSNGYVIDVTVVENSTDTGANTSNVTFTAKITKKNASWQGGSSTGRDMTITYAGTQVAYVSFTDLLNYSSHTASGTKTITHGTDGKYSSNVVVTIGGGSTYSSSPAKGQVGSWTVTLTPLPRQATISSCPDFTDEENPVLTYSNPAGTAATSLQACIATKDSAGTWMSQDVPYRDISKTGTSYTFNLTDTERKALRARASNSSTLEVAFFVATTFDTTTLRSSAVKTMTVVNANPTATHSIKETNTKVSALLGTSGTSVVRGVSNLQVTLTPSLKKEATLKSVSITNGVATGTTNPYTFNAITNGNISYTVTDSRSNKVTNSITSTVIPYIPVSIGYCDFDRVSLDDNTVVLNATINYFNGNFKSGVSNSPTITYTSENGRSGTIGTYVIDGNAIYINDQEIGETLADGEVDTFTLTVTDKLTTHSASAKILNPVPTFEAGESDFQVNGKLYIADTNRANAVDVGAKLKTIPTSVPTVFVQSTQPTAKAKGDIWFSV